MAGRFMRVWRQIQDNKIRDGQILVYPTQCCQIHKDTATRPMVVRSMRAKFRVDRSTRHTVGRSKIPIVVLLTDIHGGLFHGSSTHSEKIYDRLIYEVHGRQIYGRMIYGGPAHGEQIHSGLIQ